MKFARLVLPAMLGALQAACYQLYVKPYGHAAADDLDHPGRPRAIHMPPGAPSILNGFTPDREFAEESTGHTAIDVAGEIGTPILAAAGGKVIASYFEPMYGHHVVLDHGKRADGIWIQTRYLHLHRRNVEEGQVVERGELIGELGRTGVLAIAIPHMHFEVHTSKLGREFTYVPRNPHLYWVDGTGRVTCFDRRREFADEPFRLTYPAPCLDTAWR